MKFIIFCRRIVKLQSGKQSFTHKQLSLRLDLVMVMMVCFLLIQLIDGKGGDNDGEVR